MRAYLQALPLAAEFAIVILGGFGVFILSTFLSLLTATTASNPDSTWWYSGGHLISLIIYDVLVGAALFAFLRARGWSLERLGVRFGAVDTLIGFGLAALALVAAWAIFWAVTTVSPAAGQALSAPGVTPRGFGLATAIIVSIVDAIFEEIFVCGYVVMVLKERADSMTAVTISTAIRLLYHLYEGPIAFVGVIPFGLVMAGWYARTGRLWPVIVGHGLYDFISVVGYVS